MRRLVCCRRRTKDISIDFEEHDKVTTYNGLESILNSCTYDSESHGGSATSGGEGFTTTDSLDEDATSSCSSSKYAYNSSFSSKRMMVSSKNQEDEQSLIQLEPLQSLHSLCVKGKGQVSYTMNVSDVENMKERFAKLLLGEDVTGGTKGMSSAMALSTAICNLSASIFGELWKLEPLSEERKSKWRGEMGWFLSPATHMVELVPAKQNGANGETLEVMTPKARSDILVTLPALQKLDNMLIDVLDSMVHMEFWYSEGGSRNSRSWSSKRWWLPSPRVPVSGLSSSQRKTLGFQGKLVYQVLKAAKSINEQILLQMPIPDVVKEAFSKSAKESLGENLHQAITAESISIQEVFCSLNLKTEHSVLDTVNKLESAIFSWKHSISEATIKKSTIRSPIRSPIRYQWNFFKDSGIEHDNYIMWIDRVEALVQLIKIRFPNLPHSFIDARKVQYNKDVGFAIIEAYSRVIANVAFTILSRIGDILQEDDLKKPTNPIATLKFDFFSDVYLSGITETPPGHIRRSLMDQMNMVDGQFRNCDKLIRNDSSGNKARVVTVAKGSRYRSWCYGKEA